MKIPTFPECDHALVSALTPQSDYALVDSLQRSPTEGKYFTALFCRYSPVVYSLIRHSAKSPVQADYLFALTWRHILNELSGIDLSSFRPTALTNDSSSKASTLSGANELSESPMGRSPESSSSESASSEETKNKPEFSLQGWLINLTAAHINQVKMPDVESIHYVLKDAPPPLWCYTERALEGLAPRHRLIILMARTFEWSDTRISAYLQAEGEPVSAQQVQAELVVASEALERAIPEDIRTIYLDYSLVVVPAPDDVGRLTIEFDEVDLQL